MRLHDCALETKIVDRLKDNRHRHSLSLRAVAREIPVSTVSYYHWEIGLNSPRTFESWNRWADTVGGDRVINTFNTKDEWRSRLREKRQELKMPRAVLAERFGVTETAIALWETKHGPGSLDQWDQWSASVQCGPVVNEVYRA